jgi:hypothetical protein
MRSISAISISIESHLPALKRSAAGSSCTSASSAPRATDTAPPHSSWWWRRPSDCRARNRSSSAVAASRSCSQNGYLSSRGGCQNRWHSLVNCDLGDSINSRFDSPPAPPRSLPRRSGGTCKSVSLGCDDCDHGAGRHLHTCTLHHKTSKRLQSAQGFRPGWRFAPEMAQLLPAVVRSRQCRLRASGRGLGRARGFDGGLRLSLHRGHLHGPT